MSNKIKLFLVVMALIATFAVVQFYNALVDNPYKVLGLALKKATPLPGLDPDVDSDGLSNSQESYWNTDFRNPDTDGDGYKDGEEVLAGHDPRKKGPDDKLATALKPIDKASSLLVAGLYTGDLKTKPDANLEQIATSVVADSFANIIAAVTIEFPIVPSTPESESGYRKSMEALARSMLDREYKGLEQTLNLIEKLNLAKPETKDAFYNHVKNQAQLLVDRSKELAAIKVPEPKEPIHRQITSMFLSAARSYEVLQDLDGDLLEITTAFMNIQSLYTLQLPIVLKEAIK